ncbi:hypothetical protein SAMN02746000_03767 [Paracoccus sp. J56]|nr:hypothetical protein SAMN02746000_03767 [Paracoccus sp. J56]
MRRGHDYPHRQRRALSLLCLLDEGAAGSDRLRGHGRADGKLDDLVVNHLENQLFQPERLETVLAAVLNRREEHAGRRREHIAELSKRATESELRLKRLYGAIEAGIADLDDPALKDRIDGLKATRLSRPSRGRRWPGGRRGLEGCRRKGRRLHFAGDRGSRLAAADPRQLFPGRQHKTAWSLHWSRPAWRAGLKAMRYRVIPAFKTLIPLFAERPSHPVVPLRRAQRSLWPTSRLALDRSEHAGGRAETGRLCNMPVSCWLAYS